MIWRKCLRYQESNPGPLSHDSTVLNIRPPWEMIWRQAMVNDAWLSGGALLPFRRFILLSAAKIGWETSNWISWVQAAMALFLQLAAVLFRSSKRVENLRSRCSSNEKQLLNLNNVALGCCLWCSWHSGRLLHQRSPVRIPWSTNLSDYQSTEKS